MKKHLLAIGLWSCLAISHAATLTTRLNSESVVVGDPFQLVIESTDGSLGTPDLSPLNDAFTVLGTAKNHSYQVINGQASQHQQLIITLAANEHGEVTIPALTIGDDNSQALTLTVADASQAPQTQGIDAENGITVTARVGARGSSTPTLYRFQPIPITVRIELPQSVTSSVGLAVPKVDGAELQKVGDGRRSHITQNGQILTVIEQDYSLRAQQAGTLNIAPFVLRGEMAEAGSSVRNRAFNDPFGDLDAFFNGRSLLSQFDLKPFVVRSNALTLDIQDTPKDSAGEWFLPAETVELSATWQGKNTSQPLQLTVGDVITRKITLMALGASPEQLPTLPNSTVDGVKIYTDSDTTDSIDTDAGSMAVRVVTQSIIPERSGTFTLSEIAVKWQNVLTNQAEIARLPSETLIVTDTTAVAPPNASASADATPPNNGTTNGATNGSASNTSNFATTASADNRSTPNANVNANASEALTWRTVVAVVVGSLLVVAGIALYWGYWRKQRSHRGQQPSHRNDNPAQAVRRALREQDAKRLYQALLAFKQSGAVWTETLQSAQQQLERALFADTHPSAPNAMTEATTSNQIGGGTDAHTHMADETRDNIGANAISHLTADINKAHSNNCVHADSQPSATVGTTRDSMGASVGIDLTAISAGILRDIKKPVLQPSHRQSASPDLSANTNKAHPVTNAHDEHSHNANAHAVSQGTAQTTKGISRFASIPRTLPDLYK